MNSTHLEPKADPPDRPGDPIARAMLVLCDWLHGWMERQFAYTGNEGNWKKQLADAELRKAERIDRKMGIEPSPYSADGTCAFCQEPVRGDVTFCSPECEAMFQSVFGLIDD